MKRQSRFTTYFVPFLLVMGFILHLVNLGQYIQHGHTNLGSIISPTTDCVLALWMAYCSALLIFGSRSFFLSYEVTGKKRVIYWVATFYVTASLPGHALYLITHNQHYFDLFPWWFSPVIMVVYVFLIAFFLTLSSKTTVDVAH
jgi:hypothetical protein